MSAIVIDFFEKKAKRLGLRTVTDYDGFTKCLSDEGRADLAKLQASVEKFAKLHGLHPVPKTPS
jgi:hypothetical protein